MEQQTTLTNRQHQEQGAVDLPSIMVGLIIIGLIGAVIAATVFLVIPWAQDNAAKTEVQNVVTAQNGYTGIEVSDTLNPATLTYGNLAELVDGNYLNNTAVSTESVNVSDTGRLCAVGGTQTYQVWVPSTSGQNIYYTSLALSGKIVNQADPGYVAPDYDNDCEGLVKNQ